MRLSVLVLALASAAASADYVAYSATDDGRAPLPENIDDVAPEHLVRVEWGEYAGPRARSLSPRTTPGPGGCCSS